MHTNGVASQITPSKLLPLANLTASLIDVHLLSSSWNSELFSEAFCIAVGLADRESSGDSALLESKEEDVVAVMLGSTAADPCFGEGSDSGSMGSLRFSPKLESSKVRDDFGLFLL